MSFDEVQNIEKEKPGDIKAILPYIKGDNYKKSFHETGDSTDSVWSCGQIIGLIDGVRLLLAICACEYDLSRCLRAKSCWTLSSQMRRQSLGTD